MAKYQVGDTYEAPDGRVYEFTGGDGADKANWSRQHDATSLRQTVGEALQGATFNLADEMGIGAGALLAKATEGGVLGEIYTDMKQHYDREQAQYREDFPWTSGLAQVAGGVAMGLRGAASLAPMMAGRGLGAGIGRAAATIGLGAGGGALAGYGGAEHQDPLAMEKAQQGAMWGGGLGAVGAAALPAVRAVGRALSPTKRAEAAVRRNVPEGTRVTSPEQTLAEAGGESGEFLLQGVVANQGKTRNRAQILLDARQKSQQQRVSKTIQDIRGKNPDEYMDELETMYRTRGDVAKGQYDAAFATSEVNNSEPYLKHLLKEQPGKMGRAWKLAQERADVDPDRTPLPEIFKFSDDGERVIEVVREPDLQAWHHIQMGLRDISETGSQILPTGRTKLSPLGSDYHKMHKKLQQTLYKQAPAYEDATKNYATYSQQIEAAQNGRKFFNQKPDEVARYVESLPIPARESYVMGVTRGMQDLADRADEVHDSARRVLKSTAMRKTVKNVMGAKDGGKFIRALEKESDLSKGRQRILGGSQTAQRLQAQRGLTPSSGVPVLSADSPLRDRLLYEKKRNVIGDILLKHGPAAQSVAESLYKAPLNRSNPFWGLQMGLAGGELADFEF